MKKRIMIQASKCVGCLNCSAACKNVHRLEGPSIFALDMSSRNNPSRNRIYQKEGSYYPVFCRCCEEPDCVRSCMSGALRKNLETGWIEYDSKQCAACFMCVMMCRYGHPMPDQEAKSVIRCTFCQDTAEKEPACVKACPTKAITIKEV